MIVGGIHVNTDFYNTEDLAENTVEFFPPKDGGVPRKLAFLERALPANLFPRYVLRQPVDFPSIYLEFFPVPSFFRTALSSW